jgi:peptidoglycan hydrolase CwlO-like protein
MKNFIIISLMIMSLNTHIYSQESNSENKGKPTGIVKYSDDSTYKDSIGLQQLKKIREADESIIHTQMIAAEKKKDIKQEIEELDNQIEKLSTKRQALMIRLKGIEKAEHELYKSVNKYKESVAKGEICKPCESHIAHQRYILYNLIDDNKQNKYQYEEFYNNFNGYEF